MISVLNWYLFYALQNDEMQNVKSFEPDNELFVRQFTGSSIIFDVDSIFAQKFLAVVCTWI